MLVALPTRWSFLPCGPTRCTPAFRVISSRRIFRGAASDEAPTLADAPAPATATTTQAAASSKRRPDPGPNVLFVTRLPRETDDAALTQLAGGQAGLQQAFMYTRPTGNSVAYLVFDSAESAESAQQALHKTQVSGKTIEVRVHRTNGESKPRSRRNNPAAQQQGGSGTDQEQQQRAQLSAVYVGNLAWATLADDLKEHFSSSCSGVAGAFLLLRKDGKPNGSGFVLFDSAAAAEASAQRMNGTQLDGRTLLVKPANERQPTAPAPAGEAPAPAAAPEPGSALHQALAGAASDERRVVLHDGPQGFGWREYFGLCSAFGQVRRVAVYNPDRPDSAAVEGGSAAKGGNDAASGSSGAAAAAGGGSGRRKGKAFAVVSMEDRAAAEAVVHGLFARPVQGSKLTVMLYKQPKRAARQQQKQASVASAGEGSGDGSSSEEVVA